MADARDQLPVPFDLFFSSPDPEVLLIRYLAGTYDEFGKEALA